MRTNRVKEKLAAGQVASVIWGLKDAEDIDEFGLLGFDGVWIETEHGPTDFNDLGDLTRSCDLWGLTSIVRVNLNEQGIIYRTLDRGAQGIVVPHVNTREEAENVVQGGKFAPIGQRGMYTSRQGFGVPDYYAVANDHTLLVILIEDVIAVENLEEILKVDHIDVFFVAPADLASSMGHIDDEDHPEVQNTINDALAQIIGAGRVAGATATNDTVAAYVSAGVQFFLTEVGPWIAAGAKDFVERATISKPRE